MTSNFGLTLEIDNISNSTLTLGDNGSELTLRCTKITNPGHNSPETLILFGIQSAELKITTHPFWDASKV